MIIKVAVVVLIILAVIAFGLALYVFLTNLNTGTNEDVKQVLFLAILNVLVAIFFVLLAIWVETTNVLNFLKG